MNLIVIKGRLTDDPKVEKTDSDVSRLNFSVAVNRDYVKEGEERKADFFRCTAWRGTADFIGKYFSKGKEILLSGSMQNDPYEKDGVKRDGWKVQVNKVDFCGSKSGGTESGGFAPSGSNDFEEISSDDALPF